MRKQHILPIRPCARCIKDWLNRIDPLNFGVERHLQRDAHIQYKNDFLRRHENIFIPLSTEEEAKLLRQMADGDLMAKSSLIEHNMRLVAHVAKKYYGSGEDPGIWYPLGRSDC